MDVSVVIPYYNVQRLLTLLLQALAQQTCDIAFEVVVADDGSPAPPIIPPDLNFACTAVHQADKGFRAAAARNLGAAHAAGRWLLFLDGDTLPASDYVQTMIRRLCAVDDGHGALVMGRRRHADFASVGHDAVLGFLRDGPAVGSGREGAAAIQVLDEPQWLLDGYARTNNLGAASDEDFRLVISAVLGVDRLLWDTTDGFDEAFVGYGGTQERGELVLRHNGLHIILIIDPASTIGATHKAGLSDVIIESAMTAIQDLSLIHI